MAEDEKPRKESVIEGDAGYVEVEQHKDDHSSHDVNVDDHSCRYSDDHSSRSVAVDDHSSHSVSADDRSVHKRYGDELGQGASKKSVGGDDLGAGGTKSTVYGDTLSGQNITVHKSGGHGMYLIALIALVAIVGVIVVVYLSSPKEKLEPPVVSPPPSDRISLPEEVEQEMPKVVVTPPEKSLGQAVSFQINYVYREPGEENVKSLGDGSVLESGDRYKLFFTPEQESYVYIFQLDSSGQFYKLFPMSDPRGIRDGNVNPVKKGRQYILPGSDRSYQLDMQKGKERIYFIASQNRSDDLEDLYDGLQAARTSGRGSQEDDALERLNRHLNTRGIAGVVEDGYLPVSWQGEGNVFEIMGQRLEQVCDNCAYVVEFEHR